MISINNILDKVSDISGWIGAVSTGATIPIGLLEGYTGAFISAGIGAAGVALSLATDAIKNYRLDKQFEREVYQ
ncbi:MAG TPA: hypothetical protein VMC80_03400 [Patescibacteria group bacterium]|nr:hypothetical protein [Patescibacteria group bacterium]